MEQSKFFDPLYDLAQARKDVRLVRIVEYYNAPRAQNPQCVIDPLTRVEMIPVTNDEIVCLGLTVFDELFFR